MLKSIKSAIVYLWNFRKHLKWYFINRKLKRAIKDKNKRRLELKYEIVKMVRKYTKMDKDNVSKYIPLDEKTKAEIRFQVDLLYGNEMKYLNIKLNDKLQLV